MVDYTRALKRPFEDMGTLAIGIVLSVVPIVNFLAIGYTINIAELTLKKKYGMPEWDDWGNLFVKGLIYFIMMLAYMVPAIIVFLIGAGSVAMTGFTAIFTNPAALSGMFAGMGIFLIIGLALAAIAMIMFPAAVIGYAKTGKIDAFFDFKTISKKAFRGNFIMTALVMMVLSIVVSVVLAVIPIIGASIGSFIMGVATYTAVTEAYLE